MECNVRDEKCDECDDMRVRIMFISLSAWLCPTIYYLRPK